VLIERIESVMALRRASVMASKFIEKGRQSRWWLVLETSDSEGLLLIIMGGMPYSNPIT
jgi:hypothetical protein